MKLFPAKTLLLIPALLFCQAVFCQKKISPEDTFAIKNSLSTAQLKERWIFFQDREKVLPLPCVFPLHDHVVGPKQWLLYF